MFKKFSSAVVLFSLALSNFASAGTNLDTIKNLYDTGISPADSTDFPERNYADGSFVQPQTVSCAIIDGTDQPFGYDVARTIRNTPAYGPEIPAKRVEKLTFGDVQTSFNLIAPPTINGFDLVVVNPIFRTWVDAEHGVNHSVPATLKARKSGVYVAFQVSIIHNSSMIQDEYYYGYCYPAGLALF